MTDPAEFLSAGGDAARSDLPGPAAFQPAAAARREAHGDWSVTLSLSADGSLAFAGKSIGLDDVGRLLGLGEVIQRDLVLRIPGEDLVRWWWTQARETAPNRAVRLTGGADAPREH